MNLKATSCAALGALLLQACPKRVEEPTPPPPAAAEAPAAPAAPTYDALPRADFNLRAAEHFLPLFWREDANKDGTLQPEELLVLWGYGDVTRESLVGGEGFTPRFAELYTQLQAEPDFASLPEEEKQRREAVRLELSQGKPTLVEATYGNLTEEDRAILTHVARAAVLTERLYARQKGSVGMDSAVPEGDAASHMVFFRNQGPECVAPRTENDPNCSARPDKARPVPGLYPADLQKDAKFCAVLEKQPNAKELMDHFSVVVADPAQPGRYKAVPYSEAWKEDMQAVATELEAAASAIQSPEEAAFKAYLTAAAQGFRTNDWEPANEAWAAMGANNSKWYLRIAPDEVYYEPCAWKAGFAVSFARINPESITWQQKLDPVKGDMEKALASLGGPPYKARKVAFKLPDFIDIILNAGDARDPHGGTIGQSLPNWGPVAARGGRTVAMTNLYADADSTENLRNQMASLFCPETMKLAHASAEPDAGLLSTVLHEAAHNLGPAHEYKVKGKVDDVIFGGPLASTMEELKSQTAALYFVPWLVDRKLLTPEEAQKSQLRDVAWAFGHISRGMYTADGSPKNYSQLASIQMGTLVDAGVMVWHPELQAANGQDKGCFEVDLAKWRPAVDAMAKTVLRIKARGDRAGADALISRYVDSKGEWSQLREVITERWLRAPKASFVYAPPL